MVSYQDFTTLRATAPDPAALLTALRGIDASAGVVPLGAGHYRVKTATALSAANVTAAQNAIDTTPALTPQRAAQNEIDAWPISLLAIVDVLRDEINLLRTEINTLRAAVTPPLSPPLSLRTRAQARQAVRDKASTL